MDTRLPEWAARAPQWKIRKLYETDAQGIYDEELIDEVGYTLLARCQSFIAAVKAVQGKVLCPVCGSVVAHHGDRNEMMMCPCGWQLSWGAYFATIQHKQLSGAEPVLALFRDYCAQFAIARTPREKMMRIDALLHGFHVHFKDAITTRPVAVNLIEGRLAQVVAFLDGLASSGLSTPGVEETRATWQHGIEVTRTWYLERDEGKTDTQSEP
ncbi:MAG: hypothetical protein ACYCZF_06185 [Anaerolineae bacterium]